MDRPFSSPSGRQDAPLSFICYTVAALAFLFFIAPIRDLAAGTARRLAARVARNYVAIDTTARHGSGHCPTTRRHINKKGTA